MVWYNLKIGYWDIKISPIKSVNKEYENCDKDGNILKRKSGTYTKGTFVNEATGEEHTTAFKLINGEARAKLSKTKEVKNYKEVELKEAEDLITEKEYLVSGDGLYNDLKTTGKALKFAYCSGNGYKVYYAYLKPSELYEGFMILSLGLGKKSEVITGLVEGLKEQKKVKEVESIVQGVNKAKAEELIEI